MRAGAVATVTVAVLALAPSAGAALHHHVPPGSVLDQYEEQYPTPRGDKPVGEIHPRGDENLPPGAASALKSRPGGEAAAKLAGATASRKGKREGHPATAGAAAVLVGSGGLGVLFLILLLAILVAIALARAARRRTGRARPDQA